LRSGHPDRGRLVQIPLAPRPQKNPEIGRGIRETFSTACHFTGRVQEVTQVSASRQLEGENHVSPSLRSAFSVRKPRIPAAHGRRPLS
jgi:hypothetical protein